MIAHFLADGISCYACTNAQYPAIDTCNGFDDSTPTKQCPGVDYCLSVYLTTEDTSGSAYDCDLETPDIPDAVKELLNSKKTYLTETDSQELLKQISDFHYS